MFKSISWANWTKEDWSKVIKTCIGAFYGFGIFVSAILMIYIIG